MNRRRWLVVLAALSGCSTEPDINPALKNLIDSLEASRDCVALQENFDRTNDVDELRYIDDALAAAGCYG